MKKLLILSSLVIAGGFAAAQFASLAGLALPAALNLQNALFAFAATLVALLLHADYAPRHPLRLPALKPATAISRPRRNGYSIRRGSEAARLAPPPARVNVFPKASPACCGNAA